MANVPPMHENPVSFDAIAEAHRQWSKRYPGADYMAASTAIMRIQQVVLAQLEPLLKPLGLTFARYELLMLLSFTRNQSATMSKLGERLMIHPTTVTNLVNRLEAQEFVVREAVEGDRRITLAKITPAGRLAAERATGILIEAQFGLSGLTETEARQLVELVHKGRVGAGDLSDARAAK
jgi:DNA-binding MarR family transcriptional regulator